MTYTHDCFISSSENVILEGEDREGFFHSFVALSAHYIGLNVTQCKYLHVVQLSKKSYFSYSFDLGIVKDSL